MIEVPIFLLDTSQKLLTIHLLTLRMAATAFKVCSDPLNPSGALLYLSLTSQSAIS